MSALDSLQGGLHFFDRLRATADVLSRGLGHRSELAALEIGEAGQRATNLVMLLACGALAGLLAGFALNLLVAAIWWDSPHRVLAVGIALGAQGILCAALLLRGRSLAANWRPLETTVEQLKKDCRCVQEIFTTTTKA